MRSIGDAGDRLLGQVLRLMSVVGSIAYVPSLAACAAGRLWALMAVDTVAYAMIIAAALSRAGRRLKLLTINAVSLLLAGVLLYTTGPFGAGYVWLVCAVFVSALFGGKKLVAATAAAAVAELSAYALLVGIGRAPQGQPLLTIAVVAANLVLVCVLVGFAARSLIRGLETENAEKNLLASRLEAELEAAKAADEALRTEMEAKSVLLKELQHRVRNNLQLAQSIVGLEYPQAGAAGAAPSLDRIAMRMRALSVANDLALTREGSDSIELYDLIQGIASAVRAAEAAAEAAAEEAPDAAIAPISASPFRYRMAIDSAGAAAVAVSDIILTIRGERGGIGIGLEERVGGPALVFSWEGTSRGKDEELLSKLYSGALIGGLGIPIPVAQGGEEDGRSFEVRLGKTQ
jgi:hypothetical protein